MPPFSSWPMWAVACPERRNRCNLFPFRDLQAAMRGEHAWNCGKGAERPVSHSSATPELHRSFMAQDANSKQFDGYTDRD
jgi:hypothetical protein